MFSGIHSAESPGARKPELNSFPGMSSDGTPDVNVCGAVLVFENITTPPTSTVAVFGSKHPSTSQPESGKSEPGTGVIVISEWSAKLAGDIEIIPATKVNNKKIELIALVFIKQIISMDT